jgi:hypothetical protein
MLKLKKIKKIKTNPDWPGSVYQVYCPSCNFDDARMWPTHVICRNCKVEQPLNPLHVKCQNCITFHMPYKPGARFCSYKCHEAHSLLERDCLY